jgi:hypothetical protein
MSEQLPAASASPPPIVSDPPPLPSESNWLASHLAVGRLVLVAWLLRIAIFPVFIIANESHELPSLLAWILAAVLLIGSFVLTALAQIIRNTARKDR